MTKKNEKLVETTRPFDSLTVENQSTIDSLHSILSQKYPIADSLTTDWRKVWLWSLPSWLLLGYLLWRVYRRRLVLERHGTRGKAHLEDLPVDTGERPIYTGTGFRRISTGMRRRTEQQGFRLDGDATVQATLARGNLFSPVFYARKETPEYLLLIDSGNISDQQAGLAEQLSARLKAEGVVLQRFFWDKAAGICRPAEKSTTQVSFDTVAGRYGHRRLLLFSDGEDFLNPLDGTLQPWMEDLKSWRKPSIFLNGVGERPERWRKFLESHHFLVFESGTSGLSQFLALIEKQSMSPLKTGFGKDTTPSWLFQHGQEWLRDSRKPSVERQRSLLADLKVYLGEEGIYWFSACAVYPELHWPLTLYLGGTLKNASGNPLLNDKLLERLVRLPWLRQGFVPDWLRELLIDLLPKHREQAIREALGALLVSELENPGGGKYTLAIAKSLQNYNRKWSGILQDWLGGQKGSGPYRDLVFLQFMDNSPLGRLRVLLPRGLRKLLGIPGKETVFGAVLLLVLLNGLGLWFWTPTQPDTREVSVPQVLVAGGVFSMGDNFDEGHNDEKPLREVKLNDFWLRRYEVTFEEYDQYCRAIGRQAPRDRWGRGRQPVIYVSWYDAILYCNWKSKQDGFQPCYTVDSTAKDPNNLNQGSGLFADTVKWIIKWDSLADGYRLPTEAEWEYAAREGGKKVRFGNGQDIADPTEINFNGREEFKRNYSVAGTYRGGTVPAGSLPGNVLALHEMSGSLWEWCWDWYGGYGDSTTAGLEGGGLLLDPTGPKQGESRVLRGGSWYLIPYYARAANRIYNYADYRGVSIGFRLARTR